MFDSITSVVAGFQDWYYALPHAWAIAFLFFSLAVCFAVLTKGADLLVDGAAGLASGLGVPKVIVGATVVSLGTTLPEVSASVMASLQGTGEIAAGNAVGSIICNAGLVFGLCCVITRLPVDRFTLNRNAWFQIGGAVLLVVLYLLSQHGPDNSRLFPRWFGLILLAGLAAYILLSVHWARQSRKQNSENGNSPAKTDRRVGKSILLTVIGFIVVIVAARILLIVVEQLAITLGVPNDVIAVTLLALGTSVPELATGIVSVIKGHKEILVGNVIGANILNVFFVIGASASVRPVLGAEFFGRFIDIPAHAIADPMAIPYRFLWLHFPVMLIILGLFHLNIWTSKTHLRRLPGLIMLIIYLIYAVGSYFLP